ncbi:MAG: hypothetical protein U0804_00870 [Gemmataceae bacterium]
MKITMYHRTFPVKDAPVAVSLVPYATSQKHTYTANGKIYDAVLKEIQVVVPDDAKLDVMKNLLCWAGDKGPMKSTAREVYDFATAGTSGFKLA